MRENNESTNMDVDPNENATRQISKLVIHSGRLAVVGFLLSLVNACRLMNFTTAALEGTVVVWGDPARSPAAHVEVKVTGPGDEQSVWTDDVGRFVAEQLSPGGEYAFEVVEPGWLSRRLSGVAPTERLQGTLLQSLEAHPPPVATIKVVDCLDGHAPEGTTIAGKMMVDGDTAQLGGLPVGDHTLEVLAPGYAATAVAFRLGTSPPFDANRVVQLCPEPLGEQIRTPDGPVPPSSIQDEGRSTPYFHADQFALAASHYIVEPDTPIVPLDELREAQVAPRRRLLIRVPESQPRRSKGWIATPIGIVSANGPINPTYKTDGLYRSPPQGALRPGGYVGVGQYAWFKPSGKVEVWTTLHDAVDLQPDGVAPPKHYSVLELPSEGPWALIPTHLAKPWPIFVIHAGERK
ncbi:MAG: carboxypeptidase regulatory-like domain-containing protein [Proteobacteria bacterium]|nr:carboxypeptidase regulatory-like domain-containing protein [Pseudomonadota bacterium]